MQDPTNKLVTAAQQGDRTAQRELYEMNHRSIYRLMVRMVGIQSADDLTQQVFLQALRKLNTFSGRAQFSTWLHRLAINESLQFLRRTKHKRETVLLHEPMDHSPSHRQHFEQQELLDQALSKLDPELRSAFLLRELERLTYGEIAAILGIPEGTVASRLNRARRELKQLLLELGWEPSR